MNLELIKELKELGFIREKSQVPCISMTIKNIYQAFYSIDQDRFAIYTGFGFTRQLAGTIIVKPSIDQILSKIKEKLNFEFEKIKKGKFQDLFNFFAQEHDVHLTETQMEDIIQASKKHLQSNPTNKTSTQVNLTKTQRIEELESQVEVLNTKLQKIEDMVKDKSLKLDELEKKINHNQSLQSIEKIMEVFKEIQQLAITLKAQNKFPFGGITGSPSAKIEGNENILSKSKIDNLVGKEPKFKVGDEVIIKKDIKIDDFKNGATGDIVHSQKTSQVLKIHQPINPDGTYSFIINRVVLYLHESELEYAPKKQFQIFDRAIVRNSARDFEEGKEVVLVCSKIFPIGNYKFKMWRCYDKSNSGLCEYYYEEDLKPL